MWHLLFALAVAGISFIGFFILLLGCFIMKHRKLLRHAMLCLMAFFLSIGFIAWQVARQLPRARTANEIYLAIFGTPKPDCVTILGCFDPVIPIIDENMYISFKACPGILKKILAGRSFRFYKERATYFTPVAIDSNDSFFHRSDYGDSVLVFANPDPNNALGETIYASEDSSLIFYQNVW